jgi:metal-responsive CopG/Arc/MetJ family transcriptional regulator
MLYPINISMTEGLVTLIDRHAKSHHMTRSAFIAQATKKALAVA